MSSKHVQTVTRGTFPSLLQKQKQHLQSQCCYTVFYVNIRLQHLSTIPPAASSRIWCKTTHQTAWRKLVSLKRFTDTLEYECLIWKDLLKSKLMQLTVSLQSSYTVTFYSPSDHGLGPVLWLCPCMVGVGQGLDWGPPKGAIGIPCNTMTIHILINVLLTDNVNLWWDGSYSLTKVFLFPCMFVCFL